MDCGDFREEKCELLFTCRNHYLIFEEYPQRVLYQRVAGILPIENFKGLSVCFPVSDKTSLTRKEGSKKSINILK
jgi:hypothetical protein